MVCASILSIDTGKSRLSSAVRVAVTTTERNSVFSPNAPLSPSAAMGAASRQEKATLPVAIRPLRIKRSFPPLDIALCLKDYPQLESLKYGRYLPLFEDLSKFSHNRGLSTAGIALIVAAGFTAAGARDVHSNFSVSATVRAVANLELQSAPTGLEISGADLQRGFIDVLQPTQLTVRSNSASGFALEVLTVAPMLSSMIIEGLDSDLTLGADGGTIVQRWQKPRLVNLSLKFRFTLAPGLIAGSYPWPVRLAVRPL